MEALPRPRRQGPLSLEEAIEQRRSVRKFSGAALTREEVSQLLWAAQGLTGAARRFRAAPSAGATYPLETYVVLPEGLFRYLPEPHALEPRSAEDIRKPLAAAALDQQWVRTAGVVIALAAVPERTTARYGQRGLMYVHMEAGHVAQNVHLQAVALGLGSVAVGAFDDAAVSRVLGLPRGQIPLYLLPVGR
jgi:SagB-type dehydrogenase family enzyme